MRAHSTRAKSANKAYPSRRKSNQRLTRRPARSEHQNTSSRVRGHRPEPPAPCITRCATATRRGSVRCVELKLRRQRQGRRVTSAALEGPLLEALNSWQPTFATKSARSRRCALESQRRAPWKRSAKPSRLDVLRRRSRSIRLGPWSYFARYLSKNALSSPKCSFVSGASGSPAYCACDWPSNT